MATPQAIQALILEQLAAREMEILSLVVAIRKVLSRSENTKGDLSAIVKAALKRLVAANEVVDDDGRYSLSAGK
jgi:hypothetical protein